ncbi:MAG: helix-turn-helix domain-containing protein [Rhodobacterales bacterium]|nr:helix-turn-helix domain-containing protein [Rhodobacterales bacterium]
MASITIYLTVQQVAARLGISKATIWRWKAAGTFPAAFKLSGGSTRWRLADIEAWENTLQVGLVSDISDLPDSYQHNLAA